jgi:formylglycine-generating enzyme required for sulfatase activity
MYPKGDSRQQVSDLAGNVWEWCGNKHEDPRQTEPGGEDSRVLRGGSWVYDRGGARAVCHYYRPPDGRDYGVGFRVVCSSPIR